MIKRLEFWGGVMRQYLDSLSYLLDTGELCKNRTGIDTYSIFGYQMRFNLQHGFPAITTRKLAWRSVVGELLWFLEGSTDERRLAEITYEKPREELVGVKTIWTANADHQGKALGYINNPVRKELGPIYGRQWRAFNGENNRRGVDQIKLLCEELQQNPYSRRLIFSSWNPNQINKMALPPCHVMAQFRVMHNQLSCQLYQRSVDITLGFPFNVASYALLTHMVADYAQFEVGNFIHTSGDMHIYVNHIEGVKKQLERIPRKLPILSMPTIKSFDIDCIKSLKVSDFNLLGYDPLDSIKFDMAV